MPLRPKAPLDKLDYLIPLPARSALLPGETILLGAVAGMPAGLVVTGVAPAGSGLMAWLQGGGPTVLYGLACVALTSQGRTIQWTSSIYVGTNGLDDASAIAPVPGIAFPLIAPPIVPETGPADPVFVYATLGLANFGVLRTKSTTGLFVYASFGLANFGSLASGKKPSSGIAAYATFGLADFSASL